MIFVTIGTLSFDRLIKKVDEIAPMINDEIIMQIGKTGYRPSHTKFFGLISDEEINHLIISSELVITHGGIGSILKILSNKKPAIVIPRNKKYDKVIDDHQLEIVDWLDTQKKIKKVVNLDELRDVIKYLKLNDFDLSTDNSLIFYLKTILKMIENGEKYD